MADLNSNLDRKLAPRSDWRTLFDVAMLETNPMHAKQKIEETEALIYNCLQEVANKSDRKEEYFELAIASAVLLNLKMDKPDRRANQGSQNI